MRIRLKELRQRRKRSEARHKATLAAKRDPKKAAGKV